MLRLASTALLAFTVATVPVVADWCAVTCEAAHLAATGAPACHHTATTMPRIGETPTRCGHGHHPVVVDGALTAAVAARLALTNAMPVATTSIVTAPSLRRVDCVDVAVAGSPPLDLKLATLLRI